MLLLVNHVRWELMEQLSHLPVLIFVISGTWSSHISHGWEPMSCLRENDCSEKEVDSSIMPCLLVNEKRLWRISSGMGSVWREHAGEGVGWKESPPGSWAYLILVSCLPVITFGVVGKSFNLLELLFLLLNEEFELGNSQGISCVEGTTDTGLHLPPMPLTGLVS